MKLFFAPEYPDREYFSLALMIHQLGYTVTLSPEDDFDIGVLWEDATHVRPPAIFTQIAAHKPVINLGCTDISKRRVEAAFHKVFGYGSFVDPSTFRGRCVEKPDENAIAGGTVIDCPAQPRDGFVYQQLVDGGDERVQVEYRTPIILGMIPLVNVWRQETYQQTMARRKWLGTTTKDTAEVFSAEECRLILAFCAEMGFDFGEVDILRSRDDGKLYILDANKTPAGYGIRNRVQWDPEVRKQTIVSLAACLERRLRALLDGWQPGAGARP